MKRLITLACGAALSAGVPVFAQDAPPPNRPVVTKSHRAIAMPAPDAYWYDGNTRRALRLDREQVADFADAASGAARGRPVLRKSAPGDSRLFSGKSSPVFRTVENPRAAVRALPGGIVVTLRTPGSAEHANAALAPFGLRVTRAVDPSGLRWVVDTEAGLVALEKANQLHESGAFTSAAPDWWVGVAKK